VAFLLAIVQEGESECNPRDCVLRCVPQLPHGESTLIGINENEKDEGLHVPILSCLEYTKELHSIISITFQQLNSDKICP
jgi:hypothetical protein